MEALSHCAAVLAEIGIYGFRVEVPPYRFNKTTPTAAPERPACTPGRCIAVRLLASRR